MKIVVSGTHSSGKSTLISDFLINHPRFAGLPDPFELLDASPDVAGPKMFAAQLRIAADRLVDLPSDAKIIAERGPLDFLAYLEACADLSGARFDQRSYDVLVELTREAMAHIDFLVVLPLTNTFVPEEEDRELREAMHAALFDLIDDPGLVGNTTKIVEIDGSPSERLSSLEEILAT